MLFQISNNHGSEKEDEGRNKVDVIFVLAER